MKKKIVFLHYSLVMGGVEKVLLNILSNLNREKFEIKLILFKKEGDLLGQIPNDIECFFLETKDNEKKKNTLKKIVKTFKNIYFYYKQLKVILKKEDILINMNIRNIFINSSLALFPNKKIGWIHGNIYNDYGILLEKINYLFFKQFDLIYNISKKGKEDFDKKFPNLVLKNRYIYNSFDFFKIRELCKEKIGIKDSYIVTVGRLSNYDKGYDILIEAISLLKEDGINKKLYIIGDGEDRIKLETQIKELNLEDNVFLNGFDENPYKWMKNAEVYIMSSRGEGFGLVLVEALACEIPIVSTDCICGPREILDDGEYGILVKSENAIALKEGIKKILLDKNLQSSFKKKALKRALDFSNEKIIKQLENQILEL